MNLSRTTSLIILAAGESSRLGQPKQQLMFNGANLLQRAIEAGLDSDCDTITVVVGAYHERLTPYIDPTSVELCLNQEWKKGMASSIKQGMNTVLRNTVPNQVIIMLCDQPFVDKDIINQLIHFQRESNKSIVACTYQGTVGAPVLFDQKFFPHLLKLKGKEGAKKIFIDFPDQVGAISFPLGHIDIDTKDDYQALLRDGIKD